MYNEKFQRNISSKWINLYQLCTPIQTSILVQYALSVSDNLNVGHRETVSSPSQPALKYIILKYRQFSANHFQPIVEKSKKEGWLSKKFQEIPLSIFFFLIMMLSGFSAGFPWVMLYNPKIHSKVLMRWWIWIYDYALFTLKCFICSSLFCWTGFCIQSLREIRWCQNTGHFWI